MLASRRWLLSSPSLRLEAALPQEEADPQTGRAFPTNKCKGKISEHDWPSGHLQFPGQNQLKPEWSRKPLGPCNKMLAQGIKRLKLKKNAKMKTTWKASF